MSKASETLYDGITQVSDQLVEQAQQPRRRRRSPWIGALAAVLALAIIFGALFGRSGLSAYAIAEPKYPKDRIPAGTMEYSPMLEHFLETAIPQLLSGHDGENLVVSPLNLYLALAALSELSEGGTKAELLSLLGTRDQAQTRALAKQLWESHCWEDRHNICRLAGSVWLSKDLDYEKEALEILAQDYYCASYRGEMGTSGYNRALQTWINDQTKGLLKNQASGLAMDPETVLALVTTIYFKTTWAAGFEKSQTRQDLFHGPTGDQTTEFLHKDGLYADYVWGERFCGVFQGTKSAARVWYLLPDEGVRPEELLEDEEFLRFLCRGKNGWEKEQSVKVNLTVPKFDVASDLELTEDLKALGLEAMFDFDAANFTPLTKIDDPVAVSQVSHAARVRIDEEGVEGAAYVEINMNSGAAPPPEGEPVEFVADRPFLFVISTMYDELPLFVGIVNEP